MGGSIFGFYLQGGQFTLPLPVDPETFRDTYQGYTPYVQTVGGNPFNFFDPAMGMRLGVGDPLRGVSVQLFGGPGYTPPSDLSPTGVDTEVYAQMRWDRLRSAPSGTTAAADCRWPVRSVRAHRCRVYLRPVGPFFE